MNSKMTEPIIGLIIFNFENVVEKLSLIPGTSVEITVFTIIFSNAICAPL